MNKKVLITGAAGFIGSHLTQKLLSLDYYVTAIDNFDSYYDKKLKLKNIELFKSDPQLELLEIDISNGGCLQSLAHKNYDIVFHLAAIPGVRNSIAHALKYVEYNTLGTQNVLELAKTTGARKVIFSSSSSVYGNNELLPWSEHLPITKPINPYAASKSAAELLGHTYSYLHNFQFIALRLFSVYGERQRPDLVIHKFMKSIRCKEPIDVYGDGSSERDYTYISDIIDGFIKAINYEKTRFETINIGSGSATSLGKLVNMIEQIIGEKAIINTCDLQEGEIQKTLCDTEKAYELLGFRAKVSIEEGLMKFYNWTVS